MQPVDDLDALYKENMALKAKLAFLERERSVEKSRFQQLVESVPGIVWEVWGQPDEEHQQIDFVSQYIEKMLGYTREEWLSIPNFWLTIVPKEYQQEAGEKAFADFTSGVGGVNTFPWQKKDGEIIWAEAYASVICSEDGTPIGMRGVTLDITERKKVEDRNRELTAEITHALNRSRQAQEIADRANDLKTRFLANMSHELRTPLNAIINFIEFAMDSDYGPLSPDQEQFLTRALLNSHHLLGLINDILDISKIEAGKVELRVEECDIREIIHSIMSTAIGLTSEKGLSIYLDIPAIMPTVLIDKQRVRQVLLNLLSNAAKFTQQGSIPFSIA